MHNLKKYPFWGTILIFVFVLLFFHQAQLFAQEVKEIKIGSLHNWYREDGCEPEHGFLKIQQAGLEWPAQYQDMDCQAAKALWIATSNYTDADQYGGNFFPYKVVHVGPRGWDTEREFMPIEFKMIGRFDHPLVYVDGNPGSELMWSDIIEEVDESLPCDRLIYDVVNTSIGITMTRKIYAWAQQYHDNYFVYEYIFKNTGNVDKDPDIERPDQSLENVYVFFHYRYAVSREGATWTGLNSPRWGINAMLSSRGEAKEDYSFSSYHYTGDYEDWLNGDPDADSLRCQFAWAGKHSSASYDIIGYPNVKYKTGRLSGPQFVGVVTLHADKSATDKSDDPQQPTTTTYQQSDDPPTRPNDQFDASRMADEWKWITRGHRLPRHDEYVGDGFPDQLEGTPGGFSNMNGYGPYQLGPGDSVRLVIAEGANGLNRQLCEQIGARWIKAHNNSADQGPFDLPDGTTTTDEDVYKDSWVMTGVDSLFKTFGRARRNYNVNFDIPMPPPPPSMFEVKSGGDRIRLTWANNAESWPGFAGYRIYRAVAKYDTTYDEIFACGKNTNHPEIVNSYDDTSAVRGYSYYYYIVSFDDGTNNVGSMANPPGELHSSMFWTRTIEPAFLRRQAGDALSKIRVVPNPYNVRAIDFQYPGEPDKIMFLNIPAECIIRIYTERGDLIKTIIHDDGSGDDYWNSTTEYGQVVVSGVYIALFEVTTDYADPQTGEILYRKGEREMRKFIIIR
ncbi:hypothetical protein B6D60_07480 [candidate division KSB1 bacterium 4484_87]|nr:MAG: hypothetical protein B6D60_07480 [candidate division KSB1 bacterium 4484_87]